MTKANEMVDAAVRDIEKMLDTVVLLETTENLAKAMLATLGLAAGDAVVATYRHMAWVLGCSDDDVETEYGKTFLLHAKHYMEHSADCIERHIAGDSEATERAARLLLNSVSAMVTRFNACLAMRNRDVRFWTLQN